LFPAYAPPKVFVLLFELLFIDGGEVRPEITEFSYTFMVALIHSHAKGEWNRGPGGSLLFM
jgi:hypothetical protein